jgi:hypothetical protein
MALVDIDFGVGWVRVDVVEMILRPLSPRPRPGRSRTERLNSSVSSVGGGTSGSGSRQLSRESDELDKECWERFLKINVRHITDGQVMRRPSCLLLSNF